MTLNGALCTKYVEKYSYPLGKTFPNLALNAHYNASFNSNALYQSPSDMEGYYNAKLIYPSLRLLDASAICNGSAAVLLSAQVSSDSGDVAITASTGRTDKLEIQTREEPLSVWASGSGTEAALKQANRVHSDVDVLEPHDAYTIMAALTLESSGYDLDIIITYN